MYMLILFNDRPSFVYFDRVLCFKKINDSKVKKVTCWSAEMFSERKLDLTLYQSSCNTHLVILYTQYSYAK